MLEAQQQTHEVQRKELLTRFDVLEKAQRVLQLLEDTWRGRYEQALAALGSQGLSAVFDKKMEVILESTIKRGAASMDIALITDGLRTRIKGAKGGSVAQVLAVLLRLLLALSGRPAMRPLLTLDEPFSMVSAEYRPALCAMLQETTRRLNFQMLFTAHEGELLDAADVAYMVHPGGRVEQLKSSREDRA
jgi:ABC-type sugar transport system ATPase subunit